MAIKFLDSAGLTYFINKIVYGITSPKFSTGSTYAVGDFVIYTGKLYRCTTAVTVASAWSASKWVQTTVKGEIKALNTNLNGLAFAKNADGKWGYKAAGADPVIPFKSGAEIVTGSLTTATAGGARNVTVEKVPDIIYLKFNTIGTALYAPGIPYGVLPGTVHQENYFVSSIAGVSASIKTNTLSAPTINLTPLTPYGDVYSGQVDYAFIYFNND